jgi:hypothetical protein
MIILTVITEEGIAHQSTYKTRVGAKHGFIRWCRRYKDILFYDTDDIDLRREEDIHDAFRIIKETLKGRVIPYIREPEPEPERSKNYALLGAETTHF